MFITRLIKALKQTINSLEQDLEDEKQKNSYLTKDLIIMLKNESNNRKKIIDLENNIEILINNSRNRKIKELVQRPNQN